MWSSSGSRGGLRLRLCFPFEQKKKNFNAVWCSLISLLTYSSNLNIFLIQKSPTKNKLSKNLKKKKKKNLYLVWLFKEISLRPELSSTPRLRIFTWQRRSRTGGRKSLCLILVILVLQDNSVQLCKVTLIACYLMCDMWCVCAGPAQVSIPCGRV